jgi:hypothetical protein
MKARDLAIAGATALALSAGAHAAQSDYFLKIEGIEGEAAVAGWSFGACNAGRCDTIASTRSGVATGAGAAAGASAKAAKPPRATYDVKKMEGARVQVAAGDLDGDGAPDLAYAGTLDEVSSLSLTFQKIEGTWRAACGGKHFPKVILRAGADTFEIADATIACHAEDAESMKSGPRQSTDVANTADSGARAVKQKQWLPANFRNADMGPQCASGQCPVTMVLTGGSMKHTKSGHVTLLK